MATENNVEVEVENDDGDWGTIETHKASEESKVEYEVESEDDKGEKVPTASAEENTSGVDGSSKSDGETGEKESVATPPELDGIKTKGAEKRIKQLIKQRKDREEQLLKQQKENDDLKKRLAQYEQNYVASQRKALDTSEVQVKEQLQTSQLLMKKALEEGDVEAQVAAQTQLNNAQIQLNNLTAAKQQQESAEAEYKARVAAQQAQPQQQPARPYAPNPDDYDPKAVEWATNNEWFGQDPLMTQVALALNEQVLQEGYDPSDDDFYTEIDSRLASTFPNKFSKPQAQEVPAEEQAPVTPELKATKKPSQVVGGASRTASNPSTGRKNKVKLTQRDVEMAKKWGISLESYAQQKLNAEAAGDEYTTIDIKRGG